MLDDLLPRTVTGSYRGVLAAKWVFVGLAVLTVARSLAHIFLPDGGAQSIATIPLETFTANGAATVILIFSLWGLSQLLFGVLYVVVLWRYQALIPIMYVFIFIEYTGRLLLAVARPIETVGTAPGATGNYILCPLSLIMLALSLKRRKVAS